MQVPLVYHWSHESHSTAGYILMEWLEGEATVDTEEQLGQGLAHLHFSLSKHGYGLTSDNYIGTLPQPNGWREDWVTFLRDQRLGFQANLAEKQGMLRGKRKDNLYRLLINLEKWIPHQPGPSMLHGDLWGGNWMTGPKGAPYLIDPAVFYGDREFEIAFTELFGGYSSRFYDAYREISPLSPEYEERKHIYQLYYLLVHLNLFGESYGSSIDRVLSRYV